MSQLKVEVRFNKIGRMKFISHLDLLRVFSRAIRRASLPVTISKSFTPRFKLKFGNALKLGLEGRNLKMIMFLNRSVSSEKIFKLLNRELPEGIEIIGVSDDK